MRILFHCPWHNSKEWLETIKKQFKNNKIYTLKDKPDLSKIECAIIWNINNYTLSKMSNVKILFSLGAGVDHILNKSYPKDAHIIKLSDPNLSNQMADYILMSVLMCHRKIFQYSINKKNKDWNQLIPFDKDNFGITILGYGTIARIVIKKLKYMGFNVKVWSKTKRILKNIQYYNGIKQLHKSIKNSSCLISLLPNTSETNNIIGLSEFNLLRKECYFINVGRGMTVNEQELIYALSNAILSGAILDVFSKEPLNKKSKLWGLNNVFITPHIAGITNATDFTASLLKKNFHALISNKKIQNKIINTRGY